MIECLLERSEPPSYDRGKGHEPGLETIAPHLDRVVDELDALFAASTFALAYRAGELLINSIYNGDVGRFQAVGREHPVYQALLEHPRLRLSPTALWRSLRLYELCQRLPWVREARRINVTHVYAVLGLPDAAQDALLRAADTEGWIVAKLEAEAKRHRRVGGRGRPRATVVDALTRTLRNILDLPLDHSEVSQVPNTDAAKLESLRQLLAAVAGRCRELEKALGSGQGPVEGAPTSGVDSAAE